MGGLLVGTLALLAWRPWSSEMLWRMDVLALLVAPGRACEPECHLDPRPGPAPVALRRTPPGSSESRTSTTSRRAYPLNGRGYPRTHTGLH